MNRCASLLLLAAAAAIAPVHAADSTTTDNQALKRNFPRNALRGTITFGSPPQVKLNDHVVNLAPAYRVHGLNNLIVMSGQLTGGTYVVDFTMDLQGAPFEIWLLSKAEIAKQPWPETPQQAATWSFDPITQVWTKP